MDEKVETLGQTIRRAAALFERGGLSFGHGTGNARDEAAYLVLSALRLPPEVPAPVLATKLTPEERRLLHGLIERRLKDRIPTAYLTHVAWFCGLRFQVDERVLVPRSPIAELIESGVAPWINPGHPVRRILDIGTGSGCIAVACAYAFPDAEVDAIDISNDALAVARENIIIHGLERRVRAIHSDLFEALAGRRYDIIIGNPPYVSDDEMRALPEEYRREPALGLAGGVDGLDVVTRILRGAASHLELKGLLIVEVGAAEAALAHRFPGMPFLWLEFERGGHGVFLLTAGELRACRDVFEPCAGGVP